MYRLLFLIALLCAAPAMARERAGEPAASARDQAAAGFLTYGTAATFPPFEMVRDGQLAGFDIDLAAALAARMGQRPAPINMEFDGLIPALLGRRIDVINSAMYLSPERARVVDFIPYLTISSVVVVRRHGDTPITGYDLSLCGLRIAVTLGGIEARDADTASDICRRAGRPALTILPYPTAQDTALNLLQGRVDGAFTSRFGAAVLMQSVPDGYRIAGRPFGDRAQIGLAIRPNDAALHAALTGALKSLQADGTFAALVHKWHLDLGLPDPDAMQAAAPTGWWTTAERTAHYVASPPFVHGAAITLLLTASSLFFGTLIGILVALVPGGRLGMILRGPVLFYLWLFRGTPVLLQIIFVYNVLPLLGLRLPALTSAIVALSLNEGAYMAEIARSGLDAVKPGQRIAGLALGLSPFGVFRSITAPQAFRVVLPMLGNQVIGMLKTSALVSVIAVKELLLIADQAASANFRYLEALSAAAIYYLAFTTLFMLAQRAIERHLAPRRTASATARKLPVPAAGEAR
ncbi:ABC transporter permease subunit [Tanticharoenia sakaeratensis]|uniref:Amino acid ABC transporter n=1 Tax=Tanticharoenia sakaeratensis NBRC 103193 TaxID=1231623 RepID=A0A0D6ML20_9PROT|nr:ABC transporter permease subunit [Tanticharoenia sakaeratensis]GAN53973.1 amino acid ABC transporter [Tanticharoenia sakaeratensis NBRC 103193]GBQ23564.1 polar amino acid ABC transporter permease [Tanticharoenia sakaeratensis NBRC 103193]